MKNQRLADEHNIASIKNKILDNILLATVPLGAVASFFAMYRDIFLGFKYSVGFGIANFVSVGTALLLYIYRKKIAIELKIFVLAFLYFFAGIRGLIEIGSLSNPYILLSISFLILQLLVNRKWMITLIIAAIFLIVIVNISFAYNIILPNVDYNILMRSGQQWAADISLFLLLVIILILSGSNYHKEILKVVSLVNIKNQELDKKNQLLKEEIHVREKYQSEVIVNSRKFQMLFESSQDGIILMNEDLTILEINPSFCDISEFEREELIGKTIFDILSPKNRSLVMPLFYRLLGGDIHPLTELTIQAKNGEKKTIEFSSNLIFGASDQLTVITTIRNISSRKVIEELKFNAVLEAEENERERFSKDLHDELGPLFSTVKLYVESLKSKEKDPENEKVLDKLSEIVNVGVRQIREISHNLSPLLLREKGLKDAIETHLKWVKDTSSLDTEYEFSKTEPAKKLAEKTEIIIYRVFLELINNSIKHSQANKVIIKITIDRDWINFVFSDNGVGYDPDEVKRMKAGIGLKNIMNRIHAMNGEILFSFDQWTKTEIKLPIL